MSNDYPENLKYTKEHEWVRVEEGPDGKVAVVGITQYAQKELGDIVFLELPDVGDHFDQGKQLGTIESVKAVSDLFAPTTGEVVERNEALMDQPEMVNEDPYDKGWMLKIKLDNPGEAEALMSPSDYEKLVAESGS